jgi:hypothetical protein
MKIGRLSLICALLSVGTGFVYSLPQQESKVFLGYFKESCRGEKGWHAEYAVEVEEKKAISPQKVSGPADVLLLCPRNLHFSFIDKNQSFEFISDSMQAWVVHKAKDEKFRNVEQYDSLAKREMGSWLKKFSNALDLSAASRREFDDAFLVKNSNQILSFSNDKKKKKFQIEHRKNLNLLTVDFGNDLEPRFDEIVFEQKSYVLRLKFQKEITDKKSTDLKNYNFYAQPEDKITLVLDKAE